MAMLTREQIVTIEVLQQRGQSQRQTAQIPGRLRGGGPLPPPTARDGAADGRQKPSRIEQLGLVEAVAHWWQAQADNLGQERPPSVRLLHEFLPRRSTATTAPTSRSASSCGPATADPRSARSGGSRPQPGPRHKAIGAIFRRVDLGDPEGPTTIFAFVMVLSAQPQGGRRLEPLDAPARLAARPQRGLPPARRLSPRSTGSTTSRRASRGGAVPGDRSESNIVSTLA